MERSMSEGSDDTISMDGTLYDAALGEGLTDNEIADELEKMPYGTKTPGTPKLASAIVIPEGSNPSAMDLGPPVDRLITSAAKHHENHPSIKINRNRIESAKTKPAQPKGKVPLGPLPALFSKAAAKEGKTSDIGAYKRVRSPGTQLADEKSRPQKHVKIATRIDTSMFEPQSSVVDLDRDVIKKTLNLKVCLADYHPSVKDTKTIKNFLSDKIIEALNDDGKLVPIFKDCTPREDGVYLVCTDISCAEWLFNTIERGIPNFNHKLIIVPHDEQIKVSAAKQSHIRVVTCLPTRKDKVFILGAMAKLNVNLNTEKWRITGRRNKGAAKLTLYMRMDEESYDKVVQQGNVINWILGPVDITKEKNRSKSKRGKTPPATELVSETAMQGTPSGNHTVRPSSSEVWKGVPKTHGQIRKDKSGSAGNSHLNNSGHKKPKCD